MEETQVEIITIEEIEKLRDELRSLSKGWINKMIVQMSTRKEPVNFAKVYNIVNNVIRDNVWRMKFKKAALVVIEKLKEEING
jgi:hypothetical protein